MKKREWLLIVLCALTLLPAAHLSPAPEQGLTESAPVAEAPTRTAPKLWLGEPPVELNTADARELDTLPGIGPVLAQRIVDYREENGPFTVPEELLAVRGIGEVTLSRLLAAAGP